jgi:hypothetical protein
MGNLYPHKLVSFCEAPEPEKARFEKLQALSGGRDCGLNCGLMLSKKRNLSSQVVTPVTYRIEQAGYTL